MNASTALALVKTIQSNASGSAAARRNGAEILRRHDANHRRFNRLRAERAEAIHQLRRLLARARHEHAAAEERARVEPAQVLAEPDDVADDEHRRLAARVRARCLCSSSASVPVSVSCVGSVPL